VVGSFLVGIALARKRLRSRSHLGS
jgi:hypothetical protein